MEDLRPLVVGEVDLRRDELGAALDAAAPRHLDEEVEEHRLAAGRVDEHVAARSKARERALGGERGEHGGDRGVDRVPAFAHDLRARLRGDGMPSRNAAPRAGHGSVATATG